MAKVNEMLMLLTARLPFKSKAQKELERHFAEFPRHVVFTHEGKRWYCYDNLEHISNARSAQINGIAEMASLNVTVEDLKHFSVVIQRLVEYVEVEVVSMQQEAVRILEAGYSEVPAEQIKTLLKRLATLDTKPLYVVKRLGEEMAKRTELLAHTDFLCMLAAAMYWAEGEDPRRALSPTQLEQKTDYFKKKLEAILLRLLRSPVGNIAYHLETSETDTATSLMVALQQQKPFLRFMDMILTKEGMNEMVRSYQSGNITKPQSEPQSNPFSDTQEETKQSTNGGGINPLDFFTQALKD